MGEGLCISHSSLVTYREPCKEATHFFIIHSLTDSEIFIAYHVPKKQPKKFSGNQARNVLTLLL